jgi:hypothetical protein
MMGLGLSLAPEMKLEQNLELEQKLEQKLEQQAKLEITLEQYLTREDFIHGLIRYADENKTWAKFDKDGFNFVYAELPYSIAAPIADNCGPGFSHCMYDSFEALFSGKKVALAKGDWTLFVVKDQIPKNLADFVALHERGEELSKGNHYFATQLEFADVGKKGKLNEYVKWIDKTMPSKFIDLTQKVLYPILPEDLREYLESERKGNGQKEQELATAEKMIGQYPLKSKVLKLMDKYGKITENVVDIIKKQVGPVQNTVHNLLYKRNDVLAVKATEDAADAVNQAMYQILNSIKHEDARVVSRAKVNEILEEFSKLVGGEVQHYTQRHIIIPASFDLAYKDFVNNRTLVVPKYKPEDRKVKDF